jgi:hypothetical protein
MTGTNAIPSIPNTSVSGDGGAGLETVGDRGLGTKIETADVQRLAAKIETTDVRGLATDIETAE